MVPEIQHVAITRVDGGVSVMLFVTKGVLSPGASFEREASDDNINAEIQKAGINAVSWVRVNPQDIPPDRMFREAWRAPGGKIEVDMSIARDLHRAALRTLREPLLQQLDVDYIQADEMTDAKAKAAIAVKKQALRDVTDDPAIEAARTPETLAAIIPDALKSDS